MIILSPDVADEEIGPAVDRVSGYISDAGGTIQEVLNDSPWGRRRLAYPIRHAGRDMRDGFYAVYHFTLAPDSVQDVEREIKLNDQIMRYLVVQHKQPVTPEAPAEAAPPEEAESGETAEATTEPAATQPTTEESAEAPAAGEAASANGAVAAEAAPTQPEANPAAAEAATVPATSPETAPEAAAGEVAAATTPAGEQPPAASPEAPAEED